MVRPRKIKIINFEPNTTYFKPRGIPLVSLEEVEISFEELEALRLSNIEKLCQEDSAIMMKIHQSTFQRTLKRAREKITDALVNGKAIKIHGGDYKMPGGDRTGPIGRGTGAGRGLGLGRRNRARDITELNAGPNGKCICPKCGHEQTHIRGQPCNQIKCPKCDTMMTRK